MRNVWKFKPDAGGTGPAMTCWVGPRRLPKRALSVVPRQNTTRPLTK